jgi:hypothetical protein
MKGTTDKRLTLPNTVCKKLEGLAKAKGMSVKKMLEFLIINWVEK